jgi:hypothetical protein
MRERRRLSSGEALQFAATYEVIEYMQLRCTQIAAAA